MQRRTYYQKRVFFSNFLIALYRGTVAQFLIRVTRGYCAYIPSTNPLVRQTVALRNARFQYTRRNPNESRDRETQRASGKLDKCRRRGGKKMRRRGKKIVHSTFTRDSLDRTKPVHYCFYLINDADYRDTEARLGIYFIRKKKKKKNTRLINWRG